MKKLFPLYVMLLLIVSITPVSAARQSQPLDVPEQLDYVDAMVNDVFSAKLVEYQSQYYAEHGEYFQSLSSHSAPPELLTSPDGLLSSPTDQSTPLAALWTYAGLPAELSWSFRVDVYDGEAGAGYVLVINTVIEGVTYTRCSNYGPESWRTTPWE